MSRVVESIVRMLLDQIRESARILRQDAIPTDRAVHDARRMLKRARASLRLLRYAIGKSVFRETNASLRDAGKALSLARDAFVVLQLFQDLRLSPAETTVIASLRDEMRERYRDARRTLKGPAVAGVVKQIEGAAARIEAARIDAGTGALEKGLRTMYRNGRRSLAATDVSSTADNLHETRKHTKYLELALESLDSHRDTTLAQVRKRTKKVESTLGEERDLANLLDLIQSKRESSSSARNELVTTIEHSSRKQRRAALKLAHDVFREKPKKAVKRMTKAISKTA